MEMYTSRAAESEKVLVYKRYIDRRLYRLEVYYK